MQESTVMQRILNLIEKIDYKSVYVEIQTKENKYTVEKTKSNQIGFRTN